jgi:gamma-glutamyltranspeptidase/glutathione hydrolase
MFSKRTLSLAALLMLVTSAFAQADRSQARSMVISRHGIVATESPLASQAGAAILAAGGNAVDAAVAANAALGVVAPMMNGIGGDLFAIVYDAKTRKFYGLNASGWAPAALTPQYLAKQGITQMPQTGIFSVTVPGAVDGWDKLLRRFGTKKFPEILAPAIRLADEGFPVSEWTAGAWADAEPRLLKETNAALTYLPGGHAPVTGRIFRNPDLAASLRQIAAHGRDAFYRGPIAKKLVDFSRRVGGVMAAADLSDYSSQWVEPLSTTYRGWTVYEIPPNGQGIAALAMLNLMEQFPMPDYGAQSAPAFHVMIEAKKLAYADMIRYVADPRFASVPAAGMLSKDYARQRAKLIDLTKAVPGAEPGRPPGPARTPPIFAWLTRMATWSPTSRATSTTSAPAWFPTARVSSCKTAAASSASTPPAPISWPDANAPSTPSSPPSWRRTPSALRSALSAASTRPRLTPSSCPTLQIVI